MSVQRASYFAYFGADSKELALDRLLATQIICHESAAEKSADRTLLESNLCNWGRNSLTKRRFAWKLSAHFYHARPAICTARHYKRRAGHSSIPDPAAAGPHSFLAPYDDSTS